MSPNSTNGGHKITVKIDRFLTKAIGKTVCQTTVKVQDWFLMRVLGTNSITNHCKRVVIFY